MILWKDADLTSLKVPAETRRNSRYYPEIAAFDIETSRVEDPDHGCVAFMYLWKFAIGDHVFTGRTFDDLRLFMEDLHRELCLATDFKLCVYVQYHKYEFAFYHKLFIIDSGNFIAKSRRDVIRCTVQGVFEFRDAYAYTEKSLEKLGEEVGIPKLDTLDYSKLRHHLTRILPEEDQYADNDVLILIKYFRKQRDEYGSIARIPLTATQRVIKRISHYLYLSCGESQKIKYRLLNAQLDANKEEDMEILKRLRIAFFGGFSFSMEYARGQIVDDCTNLDISMCYGTQLLLHRYPRKKFQQMKIPSLPAGKSQLDMLKDIVNGILPDFRNKALLVRIRCKKIKAKWTSLAYLPIPMKNYFHRGVELRKRMKFQRIAECKNLDSCYTDIDIFLITQLYEIEGLEILEIWGSDYDPLPEYVKQTIYELSGKKTLFERELAAIKEAGMEPTPEQLAEYDRIKSMVSRIYGVFVQDPIRQNYIFDNKTGSIQPHGFINTEAQMDGRKNKALYRPVLYQWGVWCSAWARYEFIKNLIRIQIQNGEQNLKLLAGDTDGFTMRSFGDREKEIIEEYNRSIEVKLRKLCDQYGFDYDLFGNSGKFKIKQYQKFRTLGLKQYGFLDSSGFFDYRCAGLPRMKLERDQDGKPQRDKDGLLVNKGNRFFDSFGSEIEKLEAFTSSLAIPGDISNNKKAIYRDEEVILHNVKDYQGNVAEEIRIPSCMLLEPSDFRMETSLSDRLKRFTENAETMDAITEAVYKNYGLNLEEVPDLEEEGELI